MFCSHRKFEKYCRWCGRSYYANKPACRDGFSFFSLRAGALQGLQKVGCCQSRGLVGPEKDPSEAVTLSFAVGQLFDFGALAHVVDCRTDSDGTGQHCDYTVGVERAGLSDDKCLFYDGRSESILPVQICVA